MLSWKKSCVALAFAGVVSSSVLHSQLLAAGKKRTVSDYQQSPSMDRIRGKLLDRYGSMIPESPTPAQGSATHARTVDRKPVTVDQVVASPPKASLPHSPPQSIQPAVNVPTQAILPQDIAITERPKSAALPPVTKAASTAVSPPATSVPLTTVRTGPENGTSPRATTTPARQWQSAPSHSSANTVEPALKPAALPTLAEVKKAPPAALPPVKKEKLPTLPEISSGMTASTEKETYYPGLLGRSSTVVPTSPLPATPKVAANQTVVTTSKLPAVEPSTVWKKSETNTAPQPIAVTLPKIEEEVAAKVVATEPVKLPHHRPASPPTAGQRAYQPPMVDNIASPIVKSAVATPSKPTTPVAAKESASDPVVEVEMASTKPEKSASTVPVIAADVPSPPSPEAPTTDSDDDNHAQKKRRILPAPTAQTTASRPVVPDQAGRAHALKRTRSVMKPGATTFEPVKTVATEKTPEPSSTVAQATDRGAKATTAPTKVIASEASYASRIASTYEQVVAEGKQPMAPMVEPPEPRRASLPGHAALQANKAAPNKPEVITSATFPAAKGEKPAAPVEAVPAVSKAAPPSTKLPSEPAAPSATGLSFVIERARQGALLDATERTTVVASKPTRTDEKSTATGLPAPTQVTAVPAAPVGAPAMPVVKDKAAPKPTEQTTTVANAAVQLPPAAAPVKVSPDSATSESTSPTAVTAAKPLWSAPKLGTSRPQLPSVDPINPYQERPSDTAKPVVHEVKEEKLPPASTASPIPTMASQPAAKSSIQKSVPAPASLPVLPQPEVTSKREVTPPAHKPSPTSTTVALAPLEPKPTAKPTATTPAKSPSKSAAAPVAAVPAQTKAEKPKVDVAAIHSQLEVLRRGGIDQERQKALQAIANTPGWETVKTVGPVLRNIAMTDYNTHLRLTAVQMLGTMTSDRRMVVEALHISAEYDSDVTIRSTALRLLDQIAAAPASSQLR